MSQFGKQRLSDFYSDPNYINVNHGSYGLAPKIVIDHQRSLQERCDHNTERWFRVDSEKLINQAREYIAKQINCPAKNVYIVNNATDGINCLAKSLTWKQGDVVLLPNTAYACVRKTFNWLRQHFNITIQDINFTVKDLQSPESFQLAVENFVNSYPKKIKLAVFDHIISVPGYVCPVEALVEFFKEKKIPCFIDGAHAINQQTVDMSQLQPDAYFSNFHKWSYAPKTAAFLYLSDSYLNIVQPALTGNFHGQGPARQYYWCGTRDYSAFLSIRKGLEYSQSFGQNAVRNYNHGLAVKAALRIAEIWGTEVLTKDERCVGYMANVRVPSSDLSLCVSIAYEMMDQDNCFPIFYQFDGKVYTRISAQIYNQLKDYEFMAQKFKERLEKKMKGKAEEKK